MGAEDELLTPKKKTRRKGRAQQSVKKGMHYQDCDPYQSSICFFA